MISSVSLNLGIKGYHLYLYTCFIYIYIYVCVCVYMHVQSLQLCPTLCDPMNCSLSGSSVHGISQARILEWVAISFIYLYIHIHTYIYIYERTWSQYSYICIYTESQYCDCVLFFDGYVLASYCCDNKQL